MSKSDNDKFGALRQMGAPGPEESQLLRAMLQSLTRPAVLIEDIAAGTKFVGVRAGNRMGLSSLLGAQPNPTESQILRSLIGRPVAEGASLVLKGTPFSICLGLACLNAANTPDPSSVVPGISSAEDLVAQLGKEKQVGLVGQFPFTQALRQKVARLHLFELKDVPDAVPRTHWDEVLSQIDVLALTATTMLTRQMAYYLSHARQATIVVLGPSTPFSQTMFAYGADYLCGCVVTDQTRVLQDIRAGLAFRAIKKRGGLAFTQWAEA
jgi:uncharacterized protein (DUF4213/DUF364 family)